MLRGPSAAMAINYHREGAGPPLVLLHGVGHHWQAWRPIIDLLVPEFEIFACDSPGFGRSAPLPAEVEPTIPAYVDAFARLFDELGLERPHVAGNSMGGAIALELALRGASRSASAFSPAGFWSSAERRFCQISLGATGSVPKAARPAVAALARTRPGRVALFGQLCRWPTRMPAEEAVATLQDAWAAPAFASALAAFRHYSFTPGDPRDAPVTVAWGASDRLLPCRTQAPRARARLPWARHLTLGTGHLPYYDDPAAAAEVIRSNANAAASPTG